MIQCDTVDDDDVSSEISSTIQSSDLSVSQECVPQRLVSHSCIVCSNDCFAS